MVKNRKVKERSPMPPPQRTHKDRKKEKNKRQGREKVHPRSIAGYRRDKKYSDIGICSECGGKYFFKKGSFTKEELKLLEDICFNCLGKEKLKGG